MTPSPRQLYRDLILKKVISIQHNISIDYSDLDDAINYGYMGLWLQKHPRIRPKTLKLHLKTAINRQSITIIEELLNTLTKNFTILDDDMSKFIEMAYETENGSIINLLFQYSIYNLHTLSISKLLKDPSIDVNITQTRPPGDTPLLYVMQHKRPDLADLLLNHPKIDVNIKRRFDSATALHVAVQLNDLSSLNKLVTCLGLNPNPALSSAPPIGDIHSGAEGLTPLMIAIKQNNITALDILLAHPKINVNNCLHNGMTALYIAIELGDSKFVGKLLAHDQIDPNLSPNSGYSKGITPLINSVVNKKIDIAKLLIQHPKTNLNTPHSNGLPVLINTIVLKLTELSRLLILNPSINISQIFKKQGLMAIHYSILFDQTETTRLLLEHKDSRLNSTENTPSPLHIAAIHNKVTAIEMLLLYKKLDINDIDTSSSFSHDFGTIGQSALHIAVEKNYPKIVEQLLSHEDCDPNIEDTINRFSPLYEAAATGKLTILKQLIAHPRIKLYTPTRSGDSPFHIAAAQGHLDCVIELSKIQEFDINIPTALQNATALMIAINDYDIDIVRFLLSLETINVNTQDSSGVTALFIAASHGYTDIVKILLEHPTINTRLGPKKENGVHFPPLSIAAKKRHTECVRLLVNANIKSSLS